MVANVQVYFTELNPNSIINLDEPCHQPEFHDLQGYVENGTDENFKKINEIYFEYLDKQTKHWYKLVEHIKVWGILYPVIITTGMPKYRSLKSIPVKYRNTDSKYWMICENQGGSRILAAQKLGIKVPALINDHVGLFQNLKPLTMKELQDLCYGVDQVVLREKYGVEVKDFPKVHIDIDEFSYHTCKKSIIEQIIDQYLIP